MRVNCLNYYENLKDNPSINNYIFDKLFTIINGTTVSKPNVVLQLLNGIPIVINSFSNSNVFSSLFPSEPSVNFQENQNNFFDNLTNYSSNEYGLNSPFEKNSIFYNPPDGSFIRIYIDKKKVFEDLKLYIENNEKLNYKVENYYSSEKNIVINNEIIPVTIDINTLQGEIDLKNNLLFDFKLQLQNQNSTFVLYVPFIKYKDSKDINKYAFILTFSRGMDLNSILNYLGKKLIDSSKKQITTEYLNAFKIAKNNTNILDFLYETAPNFVLEELLDEDLYNHLTLLSKEKIDTIGTNENISILNILNSFKSNQWFVSKVNDNPIIVQKLLNDISTKYREKLICIFSKIGNSIWTNKDKEKAWNFEIYYPEFDTGFNNKTNVNEPYAVSTGFAYYNEGLKMFKIGTAIFAYENRLSLTPSNSREIGPDELQFAYVPMSVKLPKQTIYIPVLVAEYFTNKKIDEELWTILNNLVIGLLPESSAATRAVSTIAKLFSGKKIQSVEELIEFLNKIDESVLATELEEYGIGALFRGTTRNVEGELFAGNTSSIANGTSTSTDPIRAVIFGIESSSKPGRKGFLQIFVPRELEGLNLQAPNNSFKLELEVIVNTSPENLSKFAVIEIPIEDARKLIEKVYGVSLDTKIPRDYSRFLLEDTKKLTPKEALEFYKRAIKLTVKK